MPKECFPQKGQNQPSHVFAMYVVHMTRPIFRMPSFDVPRVGSVSPSQNFHDNIVQSFGSASKLLAKGINEKSLRKASTPIHSFAIDKLIGHHTTRGFSSNLPHSTLAILNALCFGSISRPCLFSPTLIIPVLKIREG
jgi:hypothetical protein